VPAGAIAAGLLVWIAVKNNPAPMMSQNKSTEVAENRDSGKADLGLPQPERREALPRPSGADKPTSKLQDNEKQELDALVSGDQAKPARRGRAGNGTGNGHGPTVMQNQIQNSIQNNSIQNKRQNAQQNPASREFDYRVDNNNADKKVSEAPLAGGSVVGPMTAENAPRASERSMKAKAAQAPAPPAAPNQNGAGAGAAAGTPVTSADANANAGKDEAVKSMTETVEVTAAAPIVATEQKEMGDRNSAALSKKATQGIVGGLPGNLRNASVAGTQIVATPDPKVFWLIGSNGTVLKTEDGDKSLRLQKTGEGMKVLAGSAVNKKVCWLIAEKGIVLRTTDGGKHWLTVSPPGAANFTAIKAVSATEATIVDTSGKVSYSTVDGGATWSVAARP